MSRSLVINFDKDEDEFNTLIPRIHDFIEDVHFFLKTKDGWGETDIIDTATYQLIIRDIKKSKLRRVTVWIEAELKRHH